MTGKNQATGEALNVQYENIYSKEISSNGKEAFLLRVTLMNGRPKIGFSRFWHNFKDKQWYPSKDHFFVPLDVWECLMDVIPNCATEIAQLGLSGVHNQLFLYLFPNLL